MRADVDEIRRDELFDRRRLAILSKLLGRLRGQQRALTAVACCLWGRYAIHAIQPLR